MIKLIAPRGKRLRDTRNDRLYSEIVCDERNRKWFVVDDGEPDEIEPDPVTGITLRDRVKELEDTLGSTRANRQYDPGEYISVGGVLYRVTSPIPAGAAIAPGANVVETTIINELTNNN